MKGIIIACLTLALLSGVFYLLMGSGVIKLAALSSEEAPSVIADIAGGCYIVGGLLILVKKHWLWIVGLVMNTLVIAIFFQAYNQKPDIILSLPGLATKIPQILLEVGLIYLVTKYGRRAKVSASLS
jgi:hypothetical protein